MNYGATIYNITNNPFPTTWGQLHGLNANMLIVDELIYEPCWINNNSKGKNRGIIVVDVPIVN